MHADARQNDPTLVRNQNALRRGRRRQWLVPGGLLALVVVVLLVLALDIQVAVPAAAIGVTVALYLAMLVVAGTVKSVGARNKVFAALMAAIAVVGLGSFLLLILVERVTL